MKNAHAFLPGLAVNLRRSGRRRRMVEEREEEEFERFVAERIAQEREQQRHDENGGDNENNNDHGERDQGVYIHDGEQHRDAGLALTETRDRALLKLALREGKVAAERLSEYGAVLEGESMFVVDIHWFASWALFASFTSVERIALLASSARWKRTAGVYAAIVAVANNLRSLMAVALPDDAPSIGDLISFSAEEIFDDASESSASSSSSFSSSSRSYSHGAQAWLRRCAELYGSGSWLRVFAGLVRPAPIDNARLNDPIVHSDRVLDRRLRSGRDFVILPEPLWRALVQWYGGGPELRRRVLLRWNEIGAETLEAEAHRPRVSVALCDVSTGMPQRKGLVPLAFMSHGETLKRLRKHGCRALRVADEYSTRMWIYWSPYYARLCGDLSATIADLVHLPRDALIMLEPRRADGSYVLDEMHAPLLAMSSARADGGHAADAALKRAPLDVLGFRAFSGTRTFTLKALVVMLDDAAFPEKVMVCVSNADTFADLQRKVFSMLSSRRCARPELIHFCFLREPVTSSELPFMPLHWRVADSVKLHRRDFRSLQNLTAFQVPDDYVDRARSEMRLVADMQRALASAAAVRADAGNDANNNNNENEGAAATAAAAAAAIGARTAEAMRAERSAFVSTRRIVLLSIGIQCAGVLPMSLIIERGMSGRQLYELVWRRMQRVLLGEKRAVVENERRPRPAPDSGGVWQPVSQSVSMVRETMVPLDWEQLPILLIALPAPGDGGDGAEACRHCAAHMLVYGPLALARVRPPPCTQHALATDGEPLPWLDGVALAVFVHWTRAGNALLDPHSINQSCAVEWRLAARPVLVVNEAVRTARAIRLRDRCAAVLHRAVANGIVPARHLDALPDLLLDEYSFLMAPRRAGRDVMRRRFLLAHNARLASACAPLASPSSPVAAAAHQRKLTPLRGSSSSSLAAKSSSPSAAVQAAADVDDDADDVADGVTSIVGGPLVPAFVADRGDAETRIASVRLVWYDESWYRLQTNVCIDSLDTIASIRERLFSLSSRATWQNPDRALMFVQRAKDGDKSFTTLEQVDDASNALEFLDSRPPILPSHISLPWPHLVFFNVPDALPDPATHRRLHFFHRRLHLPGVSPYSDFPMLMYWSLISPDDRSVMAVCTVRDLFERIWQRCERFIVGEKVITRTSLKRGVKQRRIAPRRPMPLPTDPLPFQIALLCSCVSASQAAAAPSSPSSPPSSKRKKSSSSKAPVASSSSHEESSNQRTVTIARHLWDLPFFTKCREHTFVSVEQFDQPLDMASYPGGMCVLVLWNSVGHALLDRKECGKCSFHRSARQATQWRAANNRARAVRHETLSSLCVAAILNALKATKQRIIKRKHVAMLPEHVLCKYALERHARSHKLRHRMSFSFAGSGSGHHKLLRSPSPSMSSSFAASQSSIILEELDADDDDDEDDEEEEEEDKDNDNDNVVVKGRNKGKTKFKSKSKSKTKSKSKSTTKRGTTKTKTKTKATRLFRKKSK
jgi:DUSP domain